MYKQFAKEKLNMSTNAMIYVKQKDDTIKGTYLHWDGYPSYTGNILLNHYEDIERARELVNLGGLSTIGIDINAPEIITRFGFDAMFLPYQGDIGKRTDLPEEWRNLSENERKRLYMDAMDGSYTIAYHRDRNEKKQLTTYKSEKDLKQSKIKLAYDYYHDGNEWFVRNNKQFQKLTKKYCESHSY